MSGNLYHASYKPLVSAILREGLGGNSVSLRRPDCQQERVALASTQKMAECYAQLAKDVPDSWLDDIILFEVHKSDLIADRLCRVSNDFGYETLEYHGVIEARKLTLILPQYFRSGTRGLYGEYGMS